MVLLKAQEMEKKAKSLDEKDAFAICLMKHSGEEREAMSRWRYGQMDVLEKLSLLKKYFSQKNKKACISDRFIYTLRDEFRRIKEEDGTFGLTEGIFESEIKRIVKRSIHGGKKEDRDRLFSEIFEKIQLIEIFWNLPRKGNVDNFLNLLEISSFTAPEE